MKTKMAVYCRYKKGMTLKQVAKATGISYHRIRSIACGDKKPTIKEKIMIGKVTGAPWDVISGGTRW